MTERDLQKLLGKRDDFELCNAVVLRFSEVRGNQLDAATMSEHERVVCLIWHSYGIIGNGGFQYLFEATYPGDLHFEAVLAAYRVAGCTQAAAAFADALALFPVGRPPVDTDGRLAIFHAASEEVRDEITKRFYAADDEIEGKLASYIRTNRSVFHRLLAKP